MQYPNATHFAFVPAIINFINVGAYKQASVTVQSMANRRLYNEKREVFDGKVSFDIQRAIQMCFDDNERAHIDYSKAFNDSPLKHTVRVIAMLTREDGVNTNIDAFLIDALWGTIRVGESSGGAMRRRWFVNYPFTIDVFTKFGDEFDITVDGGRSEGVIFYNQEEDATGATAFRRALLNPAQIFDPTPTNTKIHIALPHGIVLQDDNESIGLTAYTLDIDRSEASANNVYLRWVDNQGRFCYYLFKKQGESYEYTANECMHNAQGVPTAYVDGLNIGDGARQSFAQSRAMTIGARLADAQTLSLLLSLNGSPLIDMFAGYDENDAPKWQRVHIAPSKFERTTKSLQDYTAQIIFPTANLQSL